jgi:hypothetical protein
MSERQRDIVAVAAIAAVLLLVFWGVLVMRRGRGGGPEQPTRPRAGVEAPHGVTPAPGGGPGVPETATSAGEPTVARPPKAQARAPEASLAVPAGTPAWVKRQPADFTPEDLALCGRGVQVDLGQYEAAVGNEFEVMVRLVSPALESCTLVLRYDQEALVVVPESAKPDGQAFRSGIEAYATPGSGKLVIIHAGTPGKKNVDAVVSGPVVTWRMRALRPGVTRLQVLPESGFTNGQGAEETYKVVGGDVSIR